MSHFLPTHHRPMGQTAPASTVFLPITNNPLYLALIAAAIVGGYLMLHKKHVRTNPGKGKTRRKKTRKKAKRPKKRAKARKPKSVAQSVHFMKSLFTRKQAKAWARKHKFKAPKTNRGSKNFWDLRQVSPKRIAKGSFRRKTLQKGVQVTYGRLRKNPCMTGVEGSEVCF
jgi:hypothetical protein